MDSYTYSIFQQVLSLTPVLWKNPNKTDSITALKELGISFEEIADAEARLQRFAPLIQRLFPETVDGIIESPLIEMKRLKSNLEKQHSRKIAGDLYLKCDSHLKIAGSIKARGGIYEVLKHAESLAIENGLLSPEDSYAILSEGTYKDFFSKYKIAVGSTGNLGLSIGIMGSALGFRVTVHMSRDAKDWKKKLLRDKGVTVIEYEEDYGKAVEEGRKECQLDPMSYFIDDENSKDLFLGYSVAALRLKKQLEAQGIPVDANHPLYLYLPCGVGGAPGGITFGVKQVFGDYAHCYFVEPTHSPSMLLGLLTKKYHKLHINEYHIDNVTEADGLAVGSPSKLVCPIANSLLDGEYTIDDPSLFTLLALLKQSEDIKIEPSAASSLLGPLLIDAAPNSTHISWATGGLLLPDDLYKEMLKKASLV